MAEDVQVLIEPVEEPTRDAQGVREMVVRQPQLAELLGDEGYEAITAVDGASALAILEREQPAAIVLDVLMPVMDGVEFVQRYRDRPGPHAPILVLTAAGLAQQWADAMEVDAFLPKPFALPDLVASVERVAGQAA